MPLLLGLLALAAATVVLNVGSSIAVLLLGRVLQGLSAAVVWIVGLALLVDTVGPESIGYAMGYVGLAMSMGVLLAPLLGGIVFEKGGYNEVFAMCYALIGVDVVLRLVMIEKKVAAKWLPHKAAIAAANNALDRPQSSEEDKMKEVDLAYEQDSLRLETGRPETGISQSPITGAPPLTSTELPKKKRRLPPIMTLLASRRLLSSLVGIMVQATLLTSFDAVIPLYVNQIFGWNSIGAGLIFLAIVVPSFLGPWIGSLADKFGPRWLATSGFILAMPFLVLLRLVDHNSLRQKVLLCALMAMVGLALNLTLPPLMAEISYIVAKKEEASKKENNGKSVFGPKGAYAQAYALFNMAFAAGCMIGPIWAGMVNESAGWGTMAWSLGLLSVVTAVPTVVWCGGSIFKKRRKETNILELEQRDIGSQEAIPV